MHSLTILVHRLDQPSPISVPQWLATLPGLADGASPAVAGNIDPTPALCAAVPHIAAALVLHMDPSLCAQVLCNASPETWWRHSHDYGRQTVASSTSLERLASHPPPAPRPSELVALVGYLDSQQDLLDAAASLAAAGFHRHACLMHWVWSR
jgi:hypothetical protein